MVLVVDLLYVVDVDKVLRENVVFWLWLLLDIWLFFVLIWFVKVFWFVIK